MTLRILLILTLLLLQHAPARAASPLQFDDNVDPALKAQVLDDLAFLQTISGAKASPLHQEIFGALDGTNYLNWFQSHVFYFGVSDCGSPESAVACVDPKDANKIWVTNNYIKNSHPAIARLMTIFHEARHTESGNGNWAHARCPRKFKYTSIWTGGNLGWHFACDRSEYGSYASASVLLNNISKFCANCSEKVKSDAKLYSDDQSHRVIDADAKARIDSDFLVE